MGNIGLLMNGFQTALTIENIGAAFLGAIPVSYTHLQANINAVIGNLLFNGSI